MEEIWKDIKGYEGIYQASNLGKLKVLSRVVYNEKYFGENKYVQKKEKIMKPHKNKKGYLTTVLTNKDGTRKTIRMHRIIAQTFIPNPDNLPQVNHIDGNKENNRVENLEWCSNLYNMRHSWEIGLRTEDTYKGVYKKINQYDLKGNFIKQWQSFKEIEQKLKIKNGMIRRVCKGERKQTHNYIWEYAN